MFDPLKMHLSVSFPRQFTHCECSTPQKCMYVFRIEYQFYVKPEGYWKAVKPTVLAKGLFS